MSKINNLSIYLSESFLVFTFRRIRLARKMFCLSFFAVFCDFLTFGQVIDSNFEYKSFSEISKEFQNCKDVFAKLDYAKQLKKDAYDYVLDLDLDKLIIRLQNQIVINY